MQDLFIGIFYNPDKNNSQKILLELIDLLKKEKIKFSYEKIVYDKDEQYMLKQKPLFNVAIVLGGDGTLLDMVHRLAIWDISLIGINLGRLGFLTGARSDELSQVVEALKQRTYLTSTRHMLQVNDSNNIALNEVSLLRDTFEKTITLQIEVNNQFLTTYTGDGVLLATPTGSTAYALSCGGPIILPELTNILVMPVCPHKLTLRPLVLDSNSQIKITLVKCLKSAILTVDGQMRQILGIEDSVIIKSSTYKTSLLFLKKNNFINSLKNLMDYAK